MQHRLSNNIPVSSQIVTVLVLSSAKKLFLVGGYQRFGRNILPLCSGDLTTRYNPKGHNMNPNRCLNLKFNTVCIENSRWNRNRSAVTHMTCN
jgi:hypothetical protein